jgi:hypothetical protein
MSSIIDSEFDTNRLDTSNMLQECYNEPCPNAKPREHTVFCSICAAYYCGSKACDCQHLKQARNSNGRLTKLALEELAGWRGPVIAANDVAVENYLRETNAFVRALSEDWPLVELNDTGAGAADVLNAAANVSGSTGSREKAHRLLDKFMDAKTRADAAFCRRVDKQSARDLAAYNRKMKAAGKAV